MNASPSSVSDVPAGLHFLGTPATAPGPLGPQMLAAMVAIRSDPLRYLETVWTQFGDVVQFPIPRPPAYLVNDPSAVRRVLVGNARNYGKRTIQYSSLSLVTGKGLLAADTEEWKRQRPMVQPAFHHETLPRVAGHVNEALTEVLEDLSALPPGAVVDMDALMMHAALDVVGRALFGTDLSGDAARLTNATLAALDVVVARARVPVTPPRWVPTPANRRLECAVRDLDGAVIRMMRERADRRPDEASDMLDMLMHSADTSGRRLTRREVRDQAVTFIVAGHETVASALTWASALLAEHPHVQDDVASEARAVLGDRLPELADLDRLPFTRAVIDEVLRLYPPAWLITRNSHEADQLGGRDIPPGALVIMSPWLLHRHPSIWDRPDEFLPQRFLDAANATVVREGFIPFGAGPRQCIGKDFAYVESSLILATLVSRFRFSSPQGIRLPEASPQVTLRPIGGVPLHVSPR